MSAVIFMGTNEKNPFSVTSRGIGYGLFAGLPLGAAIHYCQLHKPEQIRRQFQLRDLTLFKVFGSSLSVGALGYTLLHRYKRVVLHQTPFFPSATVLGGSLLGASLYLFGSSPAIATVQASEGSLNGLVSIVGGLLGAFAYTQMEPSIVSIFQQDAEITFLTKLYGKRYEELAIPLSLGLIAVLIIIERYSKKKFSIKPYFCGFLLGLGEIFTNYVTLNIDVSNSFLFTACNLAQKFGYDNLSIRLHEFSSNQFKTSFFIALSVGILIGALIINPIGRFTEISWKFSKLGIFGPTNDLENFLLTKKNVKKEEEKKESFVKKIFRFCSSNFGAFLGGAISVFGARLCHGCGVSHSLGGILEFNFASITATAALLSTALSLGMAQNVLIFGSDFIGYLGKKLNLLTFNNNIINETEDEDEDDE